MVDLTVLSLLKIQQNLAEVREAEDDTIQARSLKELMADIFYDPAPKLSVESSAKALESFFNGLKPKDSPEHQDDGKDPDYGLAAARLAAAYGGGMWHWLNEAPLPVFNAGLALLDPMEAQRSLHQMTVIGLGNGLVEKNRSQWIIDEWKRTAQKTDAPAKVTADTKTELIAKFWILGVPVEVS